MKVQAIKCPNCGDIIFSRARHDFHYCTCEKCFVDGGFDYLRYGGAAFEDIKVIKVEVEATQRELYDDWNHGLDKFGVIKHE